MIEKQPSRTEIIQKIINLKKHSKYLEVGCDKNEIFKNYD